MKNILKSMIWAMMILFVACTDSPDDLSGKYALNTYRYSTVENLPTEKLGKGVKKISFNLKNGDGSILELAFGTKEWVLPGVAYKYVESGYGANISDYLKEGECTARLTVDGEVVELSQLTEITVSTDATGNYDIMLVSILEGTNVKCLYSGPINFEIGEDDPEASGYTIAITENPVTDANNNVYPDLTKYAVVVADPSGNPVFEIDAVNKAGSTMDELVGSYTVAGYPTQAGLADNGWVVYMPEYGLQLGGGTYFMDANNVKQYVTSGTISITRAEDANGTPLYSFSGDGLATLTPQNVPGTDGKVNILFATYTEISKPGTIIPDMKIQSSVMGKEMLYSVYLPPSWTWENAQTYPVLYLLHGADGGNNDWLNGGQIAAQMDKGIAEGVCPETVVIMPNGTVDGKNLFYCDGYQGDARYMTFFFDEFLPTVEGQFKISASRGSRMIGGLSMGGYGALYYGGLHPEMFSYVYACSPAVMIEGVPNLFDIYGGLVASGTQLPGLTIEIGTEDFLFESCGWFTGFLTGGGIPFEHITRAGAHDWAFWSACTPKIVKKLGEVL